VLVKRSKKKGELSGKWKKSSYRFEGTFYRRFGKRKITENSNSNTILGKIRTLGISNAKLISTLNFYTWMGPRLIIFYVIDSRTA